MKDIAALVIHFGHEKFDMLQFIAKRYGCSLLRKVILCFVL